MKTLKRTLSIVLTLALVFSLAACTYNVNLTLTCDENLAAALAGNGGNNTPSPTVAPTSAPTTAPTTQPSSPTNEPTEAPSTGDTTAPAAPSGELSASSSKEEVVAKYAEVYNATKATGTFIGHDSMACTDLLIEGKSNGLVKGIADGLMKTDASATYPLCPYTDSDPGNTCATKPEDIESYSFKDNGDGTATIVLTTAKVKNSRRLQDAAGNMFNVMEDLASAIESAPISWAEGDVNSNVVLTSSGTCTITYNKDTNLMTKADYVLITEAAITHANVAILKDKNATATFEYTMSYPA